MLLPQGLNLLRLPFRHWGSNYLQELFAPNEPTLCFNLCDPTLGNVVVVFMKPATLDT